MEEQVIKKLLEVLDTWCVTFMLIGTSSETPRYSQVMANDDYTDWSLSSTVAGIKYEIDWTPEELEFLNKKQWSEDLWGWWKQIRTEHLENNYKTIKSY